MGRGILPPCDTGGNVCILCNKFGYNTTLYRELTGSPQCRSVAAVPHSNVSNIDGVTYKINDAETTDYDENTMVDVEVMSEKPASLSETWQLILV